MRLFLLLFLIGVSVCEGKVQLGVDVFFNEKHFEKYKEKKIALLTNHTGVDSKMRSTINLLKDNLNLVALFSPEHGINGNHYASEFVKNKKNKSEITIYSLHGSTKRPTEQMLKDIDVIFYDIQGIGVRSYTYETSLFYIMEEAKKNNIEVVVFDRPNPLSGQIVDGMMLDEDKRSFLGYINVAYCHGMTIAELAKFFNSEYKINCKLTVIPMKGWKREMSYKETKLSWVPPSPHIPEPDTAFFSSATGILGELSIVSIGIGYTLPFKIVGAPWIDEKKLSGLLNQQKLAGVNFVPFHFKPFYGLYKNENCNGIMIVITDKKTYKPVSSGYLIMGILKSLYPEKFLKKLKSSSKTQKNLFSLVNGTDQVFDLLEKEKYVAWKLIELHKEKRKNFLEIRKKYLIEEYSK
jgi:uncharacterized protein YbbC (DUF1343 family)